MLPREQGQKREPRARREMVDFVTITCVLRATTRNKNIKVGLAAITSKADKVVVGFVGGLDI